MEPIIPLIKAKPNEPVDILSFVVTSAGWNSLKRQIRISQSNTIRILTQWIYRSAIKPIKEVKGCWRYLPNNHAKVIRYQKQKIAVLDFFNLISPSFNNNV